AIALRGRLRFAYLENPRGIVLYAGSIDFRLEPGLSVREVRERVDAAVGDLRWRSRGSGIRLLEILPARNQYPGERLALEAVNRELADLAAARHPDVKF